jgi:hypothetical protein
MKVWIKPLISFPTGAAFGFLMPSGHVRRRSNAVSLTLFAALCMVCSRGFEAGYLILKPLAFCLIAAGIFLDVMISSFAVYITARTADLFEGTKKE